MVVLGEKKTRSELLKELEETRPTLYGQPVKVEEQWSYLGQQIGRNVSECVSLTIKKRIGVACKSIFEIKNIIEDTRSKLVGESTLEYFSGSPVCYPSSSMDVPPGWK